MKFILTRTSSYEKDSEIEIHTLHDLKILHEKESAPLIICFNPEHIEIYDDYRE